MELFYFDIECVGECEDYKSFKENDNLGANLFAKKYEKMEWSKKYESIDDAYLKQSGIITTYGKICCISFGYINNDGEPMISSYYGENEKEIVEKFNNLLLKIEKKNFNLCGFRILYYDIVFLLHKLHKYKIIPANIIYLYDKKPWESRIVDISDHWKGKFAWAFSFDEVCYELGIESPKDEMDGSYVHQYYWESKIEDIKKYCEKDVLSCIRVAKHIYN